MNRAWFPSRHTRREYRLPPFECGQGHGYRPADERDLKAERETAFENGFFLGLGVASGTITLLIFAAFETAKALTP
jgi:hypothetical protein